MPRVGARFAGVKHLVGIQSGKLDIRYFYGLYYSNIWSVAVLSDRPDQDVGRPQGQEARGAVDGERRHHVRPCLRSGRRPRS